MTRLSFLVVAAFLTAVVTAAQPPAPAAPRPSPESPAPQQSTPQTPTPPLSAPQSPAPPPAQLPDASAANPNPPLQVTDQNRTMMLTLLDRIQKVTDDQMNGESKSGKVTVDRAKLDEVLANVAQLRTMLQR